MPSFGSVCEPYWSEVYIVGGGSSLRGFDLTRLQGRTVLLVNDALLYAPWATALFSLDKNWMRNRSQYVDAFEGETYLAIPEDFDFNRSPTRATYLLYVRSVTGLSTNPSCIYMGGGNSGFGAVNIAFLKKAKRIILLGYDFCQAGRHWHRGYVWQGRGNEKLYANWGLRLDECAAQLAAAGVEVLNASPISQLQAYPKISLDRLPL